MTYSCACWLIACSQLATVPAGGDITQAIKTAFDSNRHVLSQYGEIKFQYAVGTASSIDEALRGEWQTRYVAEGYYAFDKERGKYTCVFPADDEKSARVRGGDRWISPLSSSRVLTDGKWTFFDRLTPEKDGKSLAHLPQIYEGSEKFYKKVICPLDLGIPHRTSNLGAIIQRASSPEEHMTLTVRGNETFEGRDVVHLDATWATSSRYPEAYTEFLVDLERGAIPLRSRVFVDDILKRQKVYDDVQYVDDKGWFPYRMTTYSENGGLTKQFTVIKANFKAPMDRSAYRLGFPQPQPVVNVATMHRYAARDVWDLDHLPAPSSPESKPIPVTQPSPPPPQMPGEREPWPTWVIPLLVLGVVLIVAAGYVHIRRKARHDKS